MSESLPGATHDRLPELPALTGLRGFAALWVLLYHVWAMSGGPPLRLPGIDFVQGSNLLSVGWAGVDLFFCLSAFLLAMPYAQWRYGSAPRPDTGRYLLRRALRIYPAYLFQLLVLLIAAAVFDYGRVPSAHELIAHLFLWFYTGWNWVAPMVGVWFTLPIEFAFYLVLPFIAPMLDRRRWVWLLLSAVAISIGYRYLMHLAFIDEPVSTQVIAIERLPGRIDQFVIGMLAGAAFIAARLRGWRPRSPSLWFAAGLIGVIATCAALISVAGEYWGGHPLLYVWHALLSVCLVPVLLACAWGAPPALRLLANRPMRYLGDISFGVYLWHMPILLVLIAYLPEAWLPATRFWVLLATVFPLSVLVAQISRRFIELPFLRRKPAHLQ